GESVVNVEPIGKHADAFSDREGFGPCIVSEHARVTRGRTREIEQDIDRRGFSRSVRPEETVYLALLHPEVEVRKRLDHLAAAEAHPPVAVAFGHTIEFDSRHVWSVRGMRYECSHPTVADSVADGPGVVGTASGHRIVYDDRQPAVRRLQKPRRKRRKMASEPL